MPEGSVRVVAPDVGGGFGYKGKHYPEETAIAWAAKRLRRPVKWIAARSESFIADNQGRDHQTSPSSRSTAKGAFLALRVETFANIGAYVSTFGAAIPSAIYSALLAGVYRTPAIAVKVTGVFTNTLPTDAYRGAGRPEACYVLERLADRAAVELGIDRADIRRRNLIPPTAMPYKTPIGPAYDCGDFPKIFARVSIWPRTQASNNDARRGSMASCVASALPVMLNRRASRRRGSPACSAPGPAFLRRPIRVQPDGGVQALLGTHNHGQGHATTFAQVLSRGSASRLTASKSWRAIPTWFLTGPAHSVLARSLWAPPRSTARPTRSSPRPKSSPPICSKRQRQI